MSQNHLLYVSNEQICNEEAQIVLVDYIQELSNKISAANLVREAPDNFFLRQDDLNVMLAACFGCSARQLNLDVGSAWRLVMMPVIGDDDINNRQ
ncbi:unnamed protein product [Camellia sinensis]